MLPTKQYNRMTTTEKPPSDLDYGKLEWLTALIFGGQIIGGGTVGTLIGLGGWSIVPGDYIPWTITRGIGVGACVVLASACWIFASLVAWRLFRGWSQHAAWIESLRKHWLESSRARNGMAVAEQVTEFTLLPDKTRDMIMAVIWIHQQVEAGESAPWSVRSLRGDEGPMMLGAGSRSVSIGSFAPKGAERAGQLIAEAGLVRGRKGGTAGEWMPPSMEDAIEMIIKGGR